MRNSINVTGNGQTFKYLIEYLNAADHSDGQDIRWEQVDNDNVHLFEGDTMYYRDKNEWYHTDFTGMSNQYVPEYTDVSTIRIYIPEHSIDTYSKNAKYAITANTWINGRKINLGTSIFRSIDTLATLDVIKEGNNSYYEYIDMGIIDPYDIMYSDRWDTFRKNVCNEPLNINNTGSLLNVSLYIIEEYENKFIMRDGWIGGYTVFNICNETTEYMKLNLSPSLSPLGWKFNLVLNSQYDWLLTYLYETYGLQKISHDNIAYEIVLKSKDAIIPGPKIGYTGLEQIMSWDWIIGYNISDRKGFYNVFNSWNNFEEGWSVVGSLNVTIEDDEIITVVSNPIPLTQEVFKYFVKSKTKTTKILDKSDMEIINYNVVNKIENKIVQIERPDNSKSNIIQPVFFKVKDTEKLTLHPAVNENICINLDDYKSKVKEFKLQIEGCEFKQIGVNQYGVIFSVVGTSLPNKVKEGTYYVLNEDSILVTTGKYKYVV
jgi:hypothetical protein